MQEKFKSKKIFLYPNGEDSQAIYVVLKFLKEKEIVGEIEFIDDYEFGTSLKNNQDKIVNNGELWIVHQEIPLRNRLWDNAKELPRNIVFDGILVIQKYLLLLIKQVDFEEIKKNVENEVFFILSYVGYYLLHFYHGIDLKCSLCVYFFKIVDEMNLYFREYFKLSGDSIGIVRTTFAGDKHLSPIGCFLKDRGVNVTNIYSEYEYFERSNKDGEVNIFFPYGASFVGNFLNIFKLRVTTLMPLSCPDIGSKTVYISHAYIDPIAALVQRRRPLDDFWFKRRVGINGYRIVSSQSNYKIYKDEFEKLGYEGELVCGGYPSLDVSIDKYKKLSLDGKVDNNILIAVNTLDNVKMMEKFLMQIQNSLYLLSGVKIIFRPYPGHIGHDVVNKFREKFLKYDWFVYDDSSQLSAENMRNSCVLIGDYSSLVWTFPLTTLKPAILVFKDKKNLENSYNGVKFFNPLLHFAASSPEEIFNCIKKARHKTKERAQKILEYRQNEVFNLGKSGEFIANFIIEKLKEDNA